MTKSNAVADKRAMIENLKDLINTWGVLIAASFFSGVF